jgi:hypothetical protein
MNALGKTTFIPHRDFPKVLFSFPKTNSASLKTSSTRFWKPAQPVFENQLSQFENRLSQFLYCSLFSASLLVCCVSQKQCAGFWKTGSTDFDFGPPTSWASHWTEKHSGRNWLGQFWDRLNRFLVRRVQRPPAFGGSFIYLLHSLASFTSAHPWILGWPTLKQGHSLHLSHPKSHLSLSSFTSAHPLILGWPTLKQEHSLHLSHPKSHLLQLMEGPLVWGEVCLTRWWFHLYSPFLFISWAHCKLESCADLLLLEPCVPWRIEVAWESPNLWMTPRSLYHPLVELS